MKLETLSISSQTASRTWLWFGSWLVRSHWFVQHTANAWQVRLRKLLPAQVLGNPLHEAWSADGEPLERMTPNELAKSNAARYPITLRARGQ